MSSVLRTTRALITMGIVTDGLIAPTATTATAASRKTPTGLRYTAAVAGHRAAVTTEGAFGTAAHGIADNGDILVTSRSGEVSDAYVASDRGMWQLPWRSALAQYPGRPSLIAADGSVYGASHSGVFRWTRQSVELRALAGGDQGYDTLTIRAADARGHVAGFAGHYRVSAPVYGSFPARSVTEVPWPTGTSGHAEVTGMSNTGVATITQTAPNYRTSDVFPKAGTMTAAGVRLLKAPAKTPTSADAVSPDGRLIVGRVHTTGANTAGTVSWMSNRRMPVALRGAGAMTPKFVTNQALVIGEENGRVVTWQNGRKSDVTATSRLPRGWVLTSVSGVNARGQLAVTATVTATGETVAMRVTPTGRR